MQMDAFNTESEFARRAGGRAGGRQVCDKSYALRRYGGVPDRVPARLHAAVHGPPFIYSCFPSNESSLPLPPVSLSPSLPLSLSPCLPLSASCLPVANSNGHEHARLDCSYLFSSSLAACDAAFRCASGGSVASAARPDRAAHCRLHRFAQVSAIA